MRASGVGLRGKEMRNEYAGWTPEPDRRVPKELTVRFCEENPRAFKEEIVKRRVPLKLTGGFEGTEFECCDAWSDDFLLERLSEGEKKAVVRMEKRGGSDDDTHGSDNNNAFGNGNYEWMPFERFLREKWMAEDANYYLTPNVGDVVDEEDGRPEILTKPLGRSLVTPFSLFGFDVRRNQWSDEKRERDLTKLSREQRVPLRPKLMGMEPIAFVNLWMGRGTRGETSSGLHHDFHDNLYVVTRGYKRFDLWAPKEAEKMYTSGKIVKVHRNGLICYDDETPSYGIDFEAAKERVRKDEERDMVHDKNDDEEDFDTDGIVDDYVELDDDDDNDKGKKHKRRKKETDLPPSFSTVDKNNLEKYPKFREAHKISCTIKAGEMLYLPAGWFHEVFSSEKNVFQTKKGYGGHMALNYWFQPYSDESKELEEVQTITTETPTTRRMIWERDFENWLHKQKWYEPLSKEKKHYEIPSSPSSPSRIELKD